MTTFQLTGKLAELFELMDIFHTPLFLVLVDENGGFRFGGINGAHARATGLTNDMLAGKRPEDILPPRIADTVIANYAQCLEAASSRACTDCKMSRGAVSCQQSFDYEELLELPTGARWWKTHLSAVGEGGRVIALLGHSYDITEEKNRSETVSRKLSRVEDTADDLRTLSRASLSGLRGPLHQVMSFSELLRPEFKPPMDRKLSFLNGIRDAARDAMEALDGYEDSASEILRVQGPASDVDFGHLCRDQAALVDPGRNLNISFPKTQVHTDGAALTWVLQSTLERLAPMVGSEIAVGLTPDGMQADTLRLEIACDLLDNHGSGLGPADREHLIAGAGARGIVTEIADRADHAGRRGMNMSFTLAGRLSADDDLRDSAAIPRFRTGRATC